MATNDNLFREALNFIPGGVNSPVRAFKAVGGTPVFFKRAEGQYLFDTEGNRYLDLVGSWGPMILGHAHPLVVEAVKEAAGRSFCFGTPTEIETEVAKHILGLVPCIDKIRMVNSGTEACMSAIRLARGVTGRNKIIKFIGGYHGHGDSFLKQTGSGVSTFSLQDSPGIPSALTDLTLLAPYNDSEAVESLVRDNAGEIAAIIVEPVAGNMGCIPPVDGFLSSLRAIADKQNILLIFDEVMTGFRVAKAGAIQRYGIIPDIVSYGKIIGGGLPVGAFAAKKELMDQLAPDGPIYQAGTMSGNPLAMTAGLTTLKILDEEPMIYQRLEKLGAYLEKGINEICFNLGIPLQVNRVGSMISIHFCPAHVIDFESASQSDHEVFKKFFHYLLDRGIYIPPSPYESWFISSKHTKSNLNLLIEKVQNFLKSWN